MKSYSHYLLMLMVMIMVPRIHRASFTRSSYKSVPSCGTSLRGGVMKSAEKAIGLC